MPDTFKFPKRYATKIQNEEDYIILEQDQESEGQQKIIINKDDLEDIIDILSHIAGIGDGNP